MTSEEERARRREEREKADNEVARARQELEAQRILREKRNAGVDKNKK
jgi:hypothetical protein